MMHTYGTLELRSDRLASIYDAIGILLETDELSIAATARPLGAKSYQAHLRRRYLGEAPA